jgi:threonyl-tRNA synthetase
MKILLKDGSVKEYQKPMKVIEIAKEISQGLERAACAGKVNGNIVDLRYQIQEDCELSIVTFEEEDGKAAFRHTAAHILAQAVKRLFPSAKLAIGPAIKDGFYYDIDFENPFISEDITKVEEEMKKIVKEEQEIIRYALSKPEALQLMKSKGEDYKVELIEDLPDNTEISFYEQGEYVDLCAGPHLMSTKYIKAFKLTAVAGAYWRGNEKNKMLTRIYGTAFPKSSELEDHLRMLEEAAKRDHRKLGKELGLFTLLEEGPGFPFFLPKGLVLKNLLIDYWRKIHEREGYVEISTPVMLNRKLWETSGHWDHYRENMYATKIDEEDFVIKPMNCPGGMLVYKSQPHSYKELPIRIGELGLVHRHEKSGALHGLMRVRCFTQDDAHIFMM